MSLNTAHADHGVLIHAGECIILFSDNVNVDFYGNETGEFKGTKTGRMYLTTHRLIYNSKSNSDPMRSFSFPFIALQDVTVEQPMFSANFIKGKVRAQPNGNFIGEVKFKLTFKAGGAIEFGTAMLKAAHIASRYNPGASPPPYTPPAGPWYAAPPPAYQPPAQGYYGWVPPYSAFPDQPPPNSVFVSDNPPPYPGVTGVAGQGVGFSGDAKAAEAAQSAYYDPNRPQTAYVPPPYDQPPTYQESTSKKTN
ncbi:WW domain-binding protein 2 isoform X2 [Plodia interpunctella]|uniref:WW domain-binding protein 2 isoform X2 n=1 Tax=Plodia interpunctella TaxID=58824 RepID=UPI0023689A09|nr:WW domain-binding protein 2 isoform X2 [Plodia interpunctella]